MRTPLLEYAIFFAVIDQSIYQSVQPGADGLAAHKVIKHARLGLDQASDSVQEKMMSEEDHRKRLVSVQIGLLGSRRTPDGHKEAYFHDELNIIAINNIHSFFSLCA